MVPLNAIGAIGVLLGAVLGLGMWLIVSAVPRIGRPRLVERVAPYVADISSEARAILERRPSDPTV
jgi:tight adherence protein C